MRQSIVSLGSSLLDFLGRSLRFFFFSCLLLRLLSLVRRLATFFGRSARNPATLSSRGAIRGCRHHPRIRIAYISGTGMRGRRPFIPIDAERVAIPRGEPPWSCKSNKPLEGSTKSRGKDLFRRLKWVERRKGERVRGRRAAFSLLLSLFW